MDRCESEVLVDQRLSRKLSNTIQREIEPTIEDVPLFVTLFDWDDTFLPSSWIASLFSKTVSMTEEEKQELYKVEVSARKLLEEALKYSRVFIVTNAEEGWVEQSCQYFIPSVYDLLKEVTIISARKRYERCFPTDSTAWKIHTFNDELLSLRKYINHSYLSLLSIGDSLHEREAAFRFGQNMDHVITKSIKMIDMPSPSQLATQQDLICHALKNITASHDKLDLKLSVQSTH